LTKEQVKDSPDIATNPPLSHDQEIEYRNYFRWPFDWGGGGAGFGTMIGVSPVATVLGDTEVTPAPTALPPENRDYSLRAAKELMGYKLLDHDGEIGSIADFLLDTSGWTISHLAIDLSSDYAGRRVLLPVSYVEKVGWKDKDVLTTMPASHLRDAPPYDEVTRTDSTHLATVREYYDRVA
jgi:sporulation protein YlmC with PRC-barrel domain